MLAALSEAALQAHLVRNDDVGAYLRSMLLERVFESAAIRYVP